MTPEAPPSDGQLLHLFEQTLPEELQRELHLMQAEKKGKVSFAEFLGVMNARFGTGGGEMARKKWLATTLKHDGNVTQAVFRDFVTRFRWNMREVPDVSNAEAKRVFLNILPNFFNKWVIEEEQRKNSTTPMLDVKFPPQATDDMAPTLIQQLVGSLPIKVEKRPNGHLRITMDSALSANKLLRLNARKMLPFNELVSVNSVPHEMELEEIFAHIEGKLVTREMVGECYSTKERGRRVRATDSRVRSKSASPVLGGHHSSRKGKERNKVGENSGEVKQNVENQFSSNKPPEHGSTQSQQQQPTNPNRSSSSTCNQRASQETNFGSQASKGYSNPREYQNYSPMKGSNQTAHYAQNASSPPYLAQQTRAPDSYAWYGAGRGNPSYNYSQNWDGNTNYWQNPKGKGAWGKGKSGKNWGTTTGDYYSGKFSKGGKGKGQPSQPKGRKGEGGGSFPSTNVGTSNQPPASTSARPVTL